MTSANTLFNEYAGAPNASLNTLVYSTSFSRGTTEQQLSARSDCQYEQPVNFGRSVPISIISIFLLFYNITFSLSKGSLLNTS